MRVWLIEAYLRAPRTCSQRDIEVHRGSEVPRWIGTLLQGCSPQVWEEGPEVLRGKPQHRRWKGKTPANRGMGSALRILHSTRCALTSSAAGALAGAGA